MTLKVDVSQNVSDMNNPQNISFKKDIGKTTYIVNAHFNEKVKEDILSKVRSLILRAS